MPESTRKVLNLGESIRVYPPVWPGREDCIQPGDLSRIVPYGNSVYGHNKRMGINPFKSAPILEACGGVIYFDNDIVRADLEALTRIMDIRPDEKDYAVFTAESNRPGKEGFLAQMRVVSRMGLQYVFHILSSEDYDKFPDQELTIADALWIFIEHEKERWGTQFWQDKEKGLRGLFGGDGGYAREALAFGLMLENGYEGIYRIWSRAWLVTK